jgi:hypothetical protein
VAKFFVSKNTFACSAVFRRLSDKLKKRTPFTIQLLYGSSGYKQDVILGVDAGSKTIGVSALLGERLTENGSRDLLRFSSALSYRNPSTELSERSKKEDLLEKSLMGLLTYLIECSRCMLSLFNSHASLSVNCATRT